MAILNYTTTIKASKTIGEIQEMLGAAGAKSISVDYSDDRQPDAVFFLLQVNQNNVSFRLPCNVKGVLSAMTKARVAVKYQNLAHARNVAWRIIKDWTAAQLAIVEAGQAQLPEVFLPYAFDNDTGLTMFQGFENHQKQLTSGQQK